MIATADAAAPEATPSRILSLWRRLPLAVRSVASGIFVFEVLQFGWSGAFVANTKLLPQIPWNVPFGLLFLWLVFGYLDGRGWPRSTAGARRVAMRARRLSAEQWRLSLLYGFLCLVFVASVLNVVYRFIQVPDTPRMDTSMLPWWTLYPSLVMLAINAGVSEEAGFRGYMQGGLERRYGPVVAIAVSSLAFWAAHLNRPGGLERIPYLVGFGIASGALVWAARSIWPAVVAHALVDAIAFLNIESGRGPDWLMKRPAQFSETGVDTPFVVFSILLVASIWAGVRVLGRLLRCADPEARAAAIGTPNR